MGDCVIVKKDRYNKGYDTGYSAGQLNPINTETYTATSRSSAIDMGGANLYRYVDTSGVPNSNSGTYTASSRGASLDMGATNSYRYVNTNSVPNSNSGTYTASSKSASLDMGATNSYRYVNTNGVPVTISNLYTYSSYNNSSPVTYKLTASYKYVLIIISAGDGGGDPGSISVTASKTLTALFDKHLTARDYDNYTRVYYFSSGVSGNTVTVTAKTYVHISILGLN